MVDTSFEHFLRVYPSMSFGKGQMVLLKDEIPKGAYIIESGIIKTYAITPTGEERIISIDVAGQDIPIGFTFGLITKSQYFYQAFTHCHIRIVPNEDYRDYLINNVGSFYKRHVRIVKVLLNSLQHVEALEQPKVNKKLAHALLYFANTLGSTFPNKHTRRLTMTQQEVASSLGLTRETTNLTLKKLELKNLLEHTRNTYTIYVEKIKKYIGQDY